MKPSSWGKHLNLIKNRIASTIETTHQLYLRLSPKRCLLCHQSVIPDPFRWPLCMYCLQDLPIFSGNYCDNLLLRPNIARGLIKPQFEELVCIAPYSWPFDHWINLIKFNRQVNLAKITGRLLAMHLKQHLRHHQLPEVIFPMPLHPFRRFVRGFNQAECIAAPLAKSLQIKMDTQALTRVKYTQAQSSLNSVARKQNVKNAFHYQPQSTHQHVAIVDDVITTGATMNQVCTQLKQAGVKRISVWCVCVTLASD